MRTNIIFAIAAVLALMFAACDNGLNPRSDEPEPAITWPADLFAVRGQKLADISLAAYTNGDTGTFTWDSPDDSIDPDSALGAQPHSMTFTPTDTATYEVVKKNVNVRVSLADMVRITGGTYTMGTPGNNAAEKQFQVTVSDFYLGKYEVTQAQWEEVTGMSIQDLQDRTTANQTMRERSYGRGDDFAVYYVSWYDALIFCNQLSALEGLTPAYRIGGETDPDLWGDAPINTDTAGQTKWNAVEIAADSNGYRLPDEMQWEYACRAGTTTPWYSAETDTDEDNPLADYAWYSVNNSGTYGDDTYGVKQSGTKKPNDFGLYDMHGNVFEWCWDRYATNPAVSDPYGLWWYTMGDNRNNRIARGGNWNDTATNARCAYRGSSYNNPYLRNTTTGFRIARP